MGNCFGSSDSAAEDKPQQQQARQQQARQQQARQGGVDKASEEQIHEETDRLYQEMIVVVDKHAKLRGELFEQSKAAYDAGDGAKAKELSNQAKEEGKKMEAAKEAGQKKIFEYRQSHHGEDTIDLHGLQVEFAMERVNEFYEKVKAKKISPFVIITGAGNHSKDKALIKPKVFDFCKGKGLQYNEINNGSISVEL